MTRAKEYNVNGAEMGTINKAYVADSNGISEIQPGRTPDGKVTSKDVEGLPAERQQWDRPIEFLLSCIAMSVGLGNVWRFPYTAYDNGGGAFLIPYLIVLFFIGKPLYFLEMAIGQFSSKGQCKVWKMSPIFKGVGYGSAFGTACVVSYYCSLMAITVYYFIQSFNTVLPWSVCNPDWEAYNVTCVNGTAISSYNKSVPELYFMIDVLHEKDQIDDGLGMPDWKLSLCLLFSWAVILISLIKGVQSAGKVAYFTALFPYVVLIILLIRGVTLEGAWDGIYYFIRPQWEKIFEGKVWAAAISQCFFSLSVGFGPIIMFASYNPFSHNVYRDAMIISLTDTFTSLLAGFTIFAILGNLAHNLDVDVKDVAGKGPALAFASYPLAISKFEILPQLFSVLFFLMLFTLGVGSATSLAGGLITIIHDQFPRTDKKVITTIVCICGFFSGLVYVTPGGQYMLDLVDYFGASFVIYVIATVEIIGIIWVYGLNNVCRDIEFMLESKIGKVGLYWKFCWGIFIPVVLVAVLIDSLISINVNIPREYPIGALAFGCALGIFAILLLPICAIHAIMTRKSTTIKGKIMESFRPTSDWGPSDSKLQQGWLEYSTRSSGNHFFVDWMKSIKQFINERRSS